MLVKASCHKKKVSLLFGCFSFGSVYSIPAGTTRGTMDVGLKTESPPGHCDTRDTQDLFSHVRDLHTQGFVSTYPCFLTVLAP